ncbi:MAG: penicillin-binding protein 2, partial [Deltaproteobacteria bacterium]
MKKTGSYLRIRVYVCAAFFVVFFGALFARSFQLQVLEADKLKRLAARQHTKTVTVQSRRGDIYDRNLKEMAVSIEVDSIFAKPKNIKSPIKVAKALAPVLSEDHDEILKRLKSPSSFVWLKRQVDLNDNERGLISGMDGIGIVKESRRYYPNSHLASNLIGFTGLDSNGLEGVERFYDDTLKGASRKFVTSRDATGRLLLYDDMERLLPSQGMVIELTIDKTIQHIAEKSLKKAVDESDAKGGTAIVMDPHTGEVLAMASLPDFDPNDYSLSTPKHWRNRTIADRFEPGSVLKLFLIAGALEESSVKPADSFYCENGSFKVADRVFHDTKKHGWLNVSQILKYSSNIGAAKIGQRLGRHGLYRHLKAFGFGEKTGIDLPGETGGSLTHPSKWSGVTLETVSFGQGVSTTGIQIATALSAIANNGLLMKPYVVRSIKDPSGNIVSESNPVVVRRIISEGTAEKVTRMMIGVTNDGGTGVRAALSDFEVAGKTGTAQKPDLKNGGYKKDAYFSSFIGFVPARRPRLAIVVTVDEPRMERHHGGVVAAPVFREIAEESLAYLGVFPKKKDRLLIAGKEAGPETPANRIKNPIFPRVSLY